MPTAFILILSMSEAKLVLTPLGLVVAKNGEVKEAYPFGERAADVLTDVEDGRLPVDVKNFITDAIEKYGGLSTQHEGLARLVSELEYEPEAVDVSGLAVAAGFAKDEAEFWARVQEVMSSVSALRIKRARLKRDALLIQAIESLDEVIKVCNLFYARLREWYGYHFPELSKLVADMELYASIASKIGLRSLMDVERLSRVGIRGERARKVAGAAATSLGVDLDERDLDQVKMVADELLSLLELRRELESYVNKLAKEVAPNMCALVDPKIAARLIAKAGGLAKLASAPASTIQVLGAEKALFRALRGRGKPPKHGIIFQCPEVNQAPRRLRGKIARALATKLAIAARVDAYGGEYCGADLKAAFEKKLEEIRRKYGGKVRVKKGGRGKGRRA